MSWPLNNIETKDKYEPNTTLEGGPGSRAIIEVYNAAVYYQLLTNPKWMVGQARWQPEKFLAPGSRTVPRRGIFGVRVRSAVSGTPAQVTLEIVGRNE